LRAIPHEAESKSGLSSKGRKPGALGLGDLVSGLAVESAEMVGRLVSTATRGSRGVAAAAGRLDVPLVSPAFRRLCERGRHERLLGRRMVMRLIRDATVSSVADVAQFAVNEVAHSPEVAALVRTQSAGIATDAILEVRANSEQADDRLERRVQA
jgi:hypothetical protein